MDQEYIELTERVAKILRFLCSEHGKQSLEGAILIGSEFKTGEICGVPCFNAPTSLSKICNVNAKVANDFDNWY